MFSVKQAEKIFNIPRSTLYRYIRQNKLRVIKNPFGHGVIIHEDETPRLEALSRVLKAKKKGGEV